MMLIVLNSGPRKCPKSRLKSSLENSVLLLLLTASRIASEPFKDWDMSVLQAFL